MNDKRRVRSRNAQLLEAKHQAAEQPVVIRLFSKSLAYHQAYPHWSRGRPRPSSRCPTKQLAHRPPEGNSLLTMVQAAKCTKMTSPKSKTKRKNVKKVRTRKNPSARGGQQDVSADVILGLSFILENMESDLPIQQKASKDRPLKASGKLSRNDKSPEKHSRRASIVSARE